ncbi:ABC transporter substrate-binding protein [Streptomyces sp. HNM0663]|uniref:ABC transporter substrate-binding protein n=1 Tax=Streptomyces chengmaiensis TaxID=3040919 RepID=A0ABT6HFX7_9ACTN|nr:ABC transporter substrate-binding protein [Streptomyces chengmaiensis]MDH2387486.1 ABC transporter substrate-binding protein [Streptomyces chengmaiensis]
MTASTTRRAFAARTRSTSRLAAISAVAVAGTLLLTSCGDQTDKGAENGGSDKETAAASAAPLFDQLPAKYQESKVIKVGSDIAYAPMEFMDESNQPAGVDIDLGKELGKVLGVEFKFENATFDQLVLGMNNGRHDIVMSSMTDTKERQQGASEDAKGGADFVNYFKAGSAILTHKGNPKNISTLDDLCGLTVAAQRGTANEDLLKAQQQKCGDKKIKEFISDQDTDSITQLQTKRADAVITDFPVALYNELEAGGGNLFQVVGDQIDAAPYGIAVSKENAELRDALKAAVQKIIDDGAYGEVLKKWKAESGAIETATVNAGK